MVKKEEVIFFYRARIFICLGRFSFALSTVEEDEVQAAVMSPAPGFILAIMRSVDKFNGVFSGDLMMNTRLVSSPKVFSHCRALTSAHAVQFVIFGCLEP